MVGSSPQARSGLHARHGTNHQYGLISAGAERTQPSTTQTGHARAHLRRRGADPTILMEGLAEQGSSPQARSGRLNGRSGTETRGLISAGAERTTGNASSTSPRGAHLRRRGADPVQVPGDRLPRGLISAGAERTPYKSQATAYRAGSSPQARSGPEDGNDVVVRAGLISAGAERTVRRSRWNISHGAHLRRRGADAPPRTGRLARRGSSPQARSGPHMLPCHWRRVRLISAGAERTAMVDLLSACCGAHLRRRGADIDAGRVDLLAGGSSPQARSGRPAWWPAVRLVGLISAGAERTPRSEATRTPNRAHLRRRGADRVELSDYRASAGSSPQARSGRRSLLILGDLRGLISAGAERTALTVAARAPERAHLRRRGADPLAAFTAALMPGSSPQARSGRTNPAAFASISRLISAGAERTTTRTTGPGTPRAHLRRRGADQQRRGDHLRNHGLISAGAERTRG